MKPISEGKSRLASVLSDERRALLSLGSLLRVIRAAGATTEIHEVVVYGGDEAVRKACESAGAGWREDPGTGLNGCMSAAMSEARNVGFRYGMFLPADLPLITPADLSFLIENGEKAPITLAPDLADEGTNALMLDLATDFPTQLGESSFSRHVDQANRDGLDHVVHRSKALGLDVDTVADLEQLVATSPDIWDELNQEIQTAGLDEFLQVTEGTQ